MSRRFDRFVLAEEGPVMEICPLLGRVGRCFQIGDTRAEGRLIWKYLAKIGELKVVWYGNILPKLLSFFLGKKRRK